MTRAELDDLTARLQRLQRAVTLLKAINGIHTDAELAKLLADLLAVMSDKLPR